MSRRAAVIQRDDPTAQAGSAVAASDIKSHHGAIEPAAKTVEADSTANSTANSTTTGTQQSPSPRWDETPLRTKITMTTILASVLGVNLGIWMEHVGAWVWIVAAVAVIGLIHFACTWACNPFERLVRIVRRGQHVDRPNVIRSLPVHRRDEVGKLARAIHAYSVRAIRDHHQANQLRRTLDDQVRRATRKATRDLEIRALQDALTGLGNRRFMDEQFPALFDTCRRTGTDLTCIAIDMDNFKQINDTHGHAAGDELLKFLANLVKASIRSEDFAVRTGGDEFMLLMPDCMASRAKQFCYNLIALFRQHTRARYTGPNRPDLSIGIASALVCQAKTVDQLVNSADAQLYVAKRAGKGCVVGA